VKLKTEKLGEIVAKRFWMSIFKGFARPLEMMGAHRNEG
jgi:hypothetical protein